MTFRPTFFTLVPLFFFTSLNLCASEPRERYLEILEELGQSNGSCSEGEIEIVVDLTKIDAIEAAQKERFLKKGLSEEEAAEASRIGVVSEDLYWIWLRDAVYFPNQIPGSYDRLLWKSEGRGAAVLPVFPDGRIALNLNYRHATRSWELELPRGGGKKGETDEQAALRELKEETGFEAGSLVFLGEMAPDSGTIGSVIPVFLARIDREGLPDREESEAIADAPLFTFEELKQGLIDGYLEVPLGGAKRKIPLRDAFLTFALLQAQIRNLI